MERMTDVENAITRDRLRSALSRYENRPADEHSAGTVKAVNADGSYEVLLDEDVQPRTCSAGCTAGVGDRVLVCIMANGRCVAVGRMEGEVAEIKKNLSVQGRIVIPNGRGYATLNPDGEIRTLAYMGTSGNMVFGYDSYSKKEGTTFYYGNEIKVLSNEGNAINTLTGGVSIPSDSDLNDYTTVGNYTCASSIVAKTLSNCPYTGAGFALKVGNVYNNNLTQTTPSIYQELVTVYGDRYIRRLYNGTWYDWQLVLSTNNTKDYVTAQGKSGGWYYRKWSSGRAECWRTIAYSSKSTTNSYGSLYYWNTGDASISFPFTFTAVPQVVATVFSGTGLLCVTVHTLSETSFGFFLSNALSQTVNPDIMFYAFGFWK